MKTFIRILIALAFLSLSGIALAQDDIDTSDWITVRSVGDDIMFSYPSDWLVENFRDWCSFQAGMSEETLGSEHEIAIGKPLMWFWFDCRFENQAIDLDMENKISANGSATEILQQILDDFQFETSQPMDAEINGRSFARAERPPYDNWPYLSTFIVVKFDTNRYVWIAFHTDLEDDPDLYISTALKIIASVKPYEPLTVEPEDPVGELTETMTFSTDHGSVSIRYPSGWIADSNEGMAIISNSDSFVQTPTPPKTIGMWPLVILPELADLDAAHELMLQQIAESETPDVVPEWITIGGRPAFTVPYENTLVEQNGYGIFFTTEDGYIGFTIVIVNLDEWELFRPVVEAIIMTVDYSPVEPETEDD